MKKLIGNARQQEYFNRREECLWRAPQWRLCMAKERPASLKIGQLRLPKLKCIEKKKGRWNMGEKKKSREEHPRTITISRDVI